jgi:hypothetical protein
LTKEDWLAWREHPATKWFLSEMEQFQSAKATALIQSGGLNSLEDRYNVGYLRAMEDAVTWKPDFGDEEKEDA